MNLVKNFRAFGSINRIYMNYISKSIAEMDISYSDSIFLLNIGENSGISQEELADTLVINKSAIARSVKNMEEKKYIRIKRSRTDKRVKELYITDKGLELFYFLQDLNNKWIIQIMGVLTKEDSDFFLRTIYILENKAKEFNKRFQNGELL